MQEVRINNKLAEAACIRTQQAVAISECRPRLRCFDEKDKILEAKLIDAIPN
jgi:hypothetical protein